MTIEEAIRLRHSVREYLPRPLSSEQVEKLREKVTELNEALDLHIQLLLNETEAFNSRLAHYGHFKSVENLFAIVGKKAKDLDERAGYAIAQLVLFTQMLGLNTCIAGMTFKKTKNFKILTGEALVVAIAVGYGATQGKLHPMKLASKIAPDYENSPDWFKRGIDSVLLAPSALNQFKVKFICNADGTVQAKPGFGFSTKVDLGIFKRYFELGSGKRIFDF